MTQHPSAEGAQDAALRLANEYRDTMPLSVMHLWAADVVAQLRRLHARVQELERAVAAEREAIEDEWAQCVSSDLEHGVRLLNERAATEWREKYPAMAGFADAIRARGAQGESNG